MTHTLHRRGSIDELQKDYVILAMAARGVNREGAAPALARALEIFASHNPVNYGNVAGNAFTGELAEIAARKVAASCRCGVFNWERASRVFARLAGEKEEAA